MRGNAWKYAHLFTSDNLTLSEVILLKTLYSVIFLPRDILLCGSCILTGLYIIINVFPYLWSHILETG